MSDDREERGFRAVRKYADESGYGFYITDEKCREIARRVIAATSSSEEDDTPADR